MVRSCAAFLSLFLLVPCGLGEEKGSSQKPLGTWKHDAGDHKITLVVKGDVLLLQVVADGDHYIKATSSYGVTPDGILFGIITKVDSKGIDNAPTGREMFSFKVKRDKNTLTISDVKSSHEEEAAKGLLQGEYELEKEK